MDPTGPQPPSDSAADERAWRVRLAEAARQAADALPADEPSLRQLRGDLEDLHARLVGELGD